MHKHNLYIASRERNSKLKKETMVKKPSKEDKVSPVEELDSEDFDDGVFEGLASTSEDD
jgi:hypothetical protein